MTLYPYVATLAVDPITLMAAKGATGTIHPPADTSFASPLTATDATGNPIPLTANADGILPSFYATEPAVNWRSGTYVFPLVTSQPLPGPKGEDGGRGNDGIDGKDGAPGVNAVPTAQAVATYATTPGNPVNTALSATFVGQAASWLSVKAYGAVGDGMARTVADAAFGIIGPGKRFATLSAAQASVGAGGTGITDLASTDQLDWAAHQWVINLLNGAGGGTMFTPRGKYLHNRTVTFPIGWSDQTNYQRGHQVNWTGEGALSQIKMTVDLGAGAYAVTTAQRGTNGGQADKSSGTWSNLRLTGPDETTITRGVAPCQMSGWGIGAARSCSELIGEFFYSAFDVVGDHGTCTNLSGSSSYYGLFLGYSANLYGDWTMINCKFGRLAYAGIAIHGDSAVTSGFKFIKGGVFSSPYGMVKLAGTSLKAMFDSSLEQFMFEDNGNAAITDASSISGGAPTALWQDMDFTRCAMDLEPAYAIADHGAYAVVNMGKAYGVRFKDFKNPTAVKPGSRAIFDIAEFDGFTLEADLDILAGNAGAANRPVFYRRANHFAYSTRLRNISSGFNGWQGEGFLAECLGQTNRGYGLRWVSSTVDVMTARTVGNAGFAGVSLETSTANNQLVMVASRGRHVPVVMDSSSSPGNWLFPSSAAAGKFASAVSQSGGKVMGWKEGSSGSAGYANLSGELAHVSATKPVTVVEFGTYTVRGDVNTYGVLRFTAPAGCAITVPANATDAMAIGVEFTLVAEGTTGLTLAPAAGVTVLGGTSVAAGTVKRLTKLAVDLWALS
jgi:hypothetical protein